MAPGAEGLSVEQTRVRNLQAIIDIVNPEGPEELDMYAVMVLGGLRRMITGSTNPYTGEAVTPSAVEDRILADQTDNLSVINALGREFAIDASSLMVLESMPPTVVWTLRRIDGTVFEIRMHGTDALGKGFELVEKTPIENPDTEARKTNTAALRAIIAEAIGNDSVTEGIIAQWLGLNQIFTPTPLSDLKRNVAGYARYLNHLGISMHFAPMVVETFPAQHVIHLRLLSGQRWDITIVGDNDAFKYMQFTKVM